MTNPRVVELGDVTSLQAGVGFPLDLQGRNTGDYPLAKVGDISRAGRSGKAILSTADHYVDETDLSRLGAKPIPAGATLFAKIGEAIRQNHRAVSGCAMLIDNNAMAAIPGPEVAGCYLYHFLRTIDLYPIASSTTVPSLRKSDLVRIKFPLPPLAEQRRIAEILNRAEALRAKRRAALVQLDALRQSLFLDLFGDPRKKDSVGNTPTKRCLLGELTSIRTGKLDANAADENGAHPFFTCAVESLRINTHAFDCKAVLVAGNGDLNVKYFEGKFNAYQRTYVIESLDESVLVPTFLHAFLDLYVSELRKQAIGGVIKYIKLPYLSDAVIQLPPQEWQHEFARRVAAVERLKASQRAALAALDALFASLQHRAFRGEL